MKTLIITAVAMSSGPLSSPTFAGGSVVGSHAMPIVDPDPAGIGTYLVSAVLLALGIAIFLYILFGEARANRGQEQDGLAAAETGAAPVLGSAARGRLLERRRRSLVPAAAQSGHSSTASGSMAGAAKKYRQLGHCRLTMPGGGSQG